MDDPSSWVLVLKELGAVGLLLFWMWRLGPQIKKNNEVMAVLEDELEKWNKDKQ